MNKLEKKLLDYDWCYVDGVFTTVYNGFGFVVLRLNEQMRLICLTKEVTQELLEFGNTKPPKIRNCAPWQDHCSLLTIPASIEFVVEILDSAFPELGL